MSKKLLNPSLTLSCLASILTFAHTAIAQESIIDIIPDFTPEEQQSLSKDAGLFTSAIMVFTGLNAVSGGNFTFDRNDGERDTTLDTFRLPYTHTYGKETDTISPLARVTLGQSNLRNVNTQYSNILKEEKDSLPSFIADLPNLPDFVKTDSTSLSLGGGFTYRPTSALSITPAMDFIWTHIKRRYDFNNFLSGLIAQKYDRDLFNTSVEAMGYSPSIKAEYRFGDANGFNFTPSTNFTYLASYDLWSKSRYSNFSSDATVLFTALDLNIPTNCTIFDAPMKINPFVNRTDLGLAAQDASGLWYFYDVGANFTFDVKDQSSWFQSIKLGASYSFGDDFTGYRLGAGVEL